VVLLLAVTAWPQLAAQNADSTRAKLEVGADFLKSGDIELATKTLTQVAEADPRNWRARALLALAYLNSGQLDRVGTELERLKTLKAPEAAIEAVQRQLSGRKQSNQLRDDLTTLLRAGKSGQTLSRIDGADLPSSAKQLLRAYVAMLRGDFNEAIQLTADPAFAEFNVRLKQRADEYVTAREAALVGLSYLGRRYCGPDVWDMRLCEDHRLSSSERATWDTIRSGDGRVSAVFMQENLNPSFWVANRGQWIQGMIPQTVTAMRAREDVALELISRFVSLAPLHADALQAATVMALYSGSREALTIAAHRSINESGAWMLKTRQCSRPIRVYRICSVGDSKISNNLPDEGMLVFDTRARRLRFHVVQPSAWLTTVRPALGAVKFEVPFDQVKAIRSGPRATMRAGTGPWLDDGLLFEFGARATVPMFLDFTLDLTLGEAVAVALKALEDVTAVMGELLPGATVEFRPELKGGSFLDSLTKATAGTAVVLGSASGAADAVATGRQILADQAGVDATNQRALSSVGQTLTELRARDGRSMLDAATEEAGLRQDVEALVDLTLR